MGWAVENDPAGDAAAPTANADRRFSSSALAHDGQAGDCPARVRYSN